MEDRNKLQSEWKRPDEVMQLHRLKMKKRALQARINNTRINKKNLESEPTQKSNNQNIVSNHCVGQKRKNPFIKDETDKKFNITPPDIEASNDNTLFELLKIKVPKVSETENSINDCSLTFSNAFLQLEASKNILDLEIPKGEKYIPIDWTLKTKMRFMSPKPFPWNCKLKTSEEASGTTGFVRCLDISEQHSTLDTSPNARLHQCCLIWQHPSLPWLELFPRSTGKVSANLTSNSMIVNNMLIKEALYKEWSESFRSLFHLLRARQCPYFYVCATNFTVLFRAAGICGISEAHALLTPTTRGFRQSLKQEEIEYTMPLRKDCKRQSDVTDSGCDTADSATSLSYTENQNLDDEEDETQDEWLQSLGVENSEIRKINNSQARMTLEKETELDNMKQSLIFVKGVESQALFNFLINCKSAITTTGPLAGVPPTLLSPVAFHGATLKPIRVKESIVRVDSEKYFSLELKGPLLPHVLPSLCSLMKSSQLEQYSASCARLHSTTSFSAMKNNFEQMELGNIPKIPENVFGKENLSDCGFSSELLKDFCSPNPTNIQIIENIKFSNNSYTWS
ncbi:protein downstream neighbor of son homolog [Bombus impatiens]|uniref:Protein downstream neighbor of son homolog n=1 Tax=Bombus impatiens TaxID=132113 RepID=A0A6P3UP81_BOMIM|nr:protein downstream neighbor of son homolog [Bombus impatiens]XP_012237901.1 protein downstream neighbor of son homolog [Bombus impatiens]XP_024221631.1 protein downstream neighbor of son homolog [Bombus impatiens]